MATLCRGKTLWAIVCPPIILQKYAQVYVEYVNFSWTYVTLFKLVVRILVNKNLIRIGTIFLCSYDNFFPFVDKKEFDFSCKLSKFLLHLEGGGGIHCPYRKSFYNVPINSKQPHFLSLLALQHEQILMDFTIDQPSRDKIEGDSGNMTPTLEPRTLGLPWPEQLLHEIRKRENYLIGKHYLVK